MEIEKEQLFRDVNPKKQLLEKQETDTIVVDAPVEEEKVISEPTVSKRKTIFRASKERFSEDVDKELEKTKEELAVIKEVREELVALYANNKDLIFEKEKLSKELEELKSSNSLLSEKLSRYEQAEKEIAEKKRLERLQSLSAKFKKLGQEKTVEYLSGKDEETIDEFEKIVDAAIDKAEESSDAEVVTEPSQGTSETTNEEEPEKVEEKKTVVNVNEKEQFFAGMLRKMAKQQGSSANNVQYF